jgi:pSer/pThr/pTyr-binding forkhead associated (FHA) protein
VCETGAQFCKFCGAALHEPAVASTPIASFVPSKPQPVAQPIPQPQVAVAAPTPAPSPVAVPAPVAVAPVVVSTPVVASTHGTVPLNQPALSRTTTAAGRLVVIAKDGGEGASFAIGERLDIGRSEGEIVVADDMYLSPRHARLFWSEKTLYLRDLGSTNGVFLKLPLKKAGSPRDANPDAVRGVEVPLRDQDLILLGQQVIRFEVVKDAEEGFGPAVQHGTLLFGTPTAPRYARLCQRTVEGVTRDIFYVRKLETVLGRESGDIVFTEDPFLSRRHAVLRVDAVKRTFSLADHGSSNGTFLQIRSDVPVTTGDEFRVGQQLFRVDLTPEGGRNHAGSVS